MLDPDEEFGVAQRFGVARAQVRRDHLISHLLAALSEHVAEQVVFFGGTALSRSFVPEGRLSEDIDLIAVGRRRDVVSAVEQCLVRGTRREYPGLRWRQRLSEVRDVEPALLTAPDGTTVRVQLLNPVGYPAWPTAPRALDQRYSDAPPATLVIPALESFVAWKTVAWLDRAASRDLYDLWSLARLGAIDHNSATLFARHGPTNKPPAPAMFATAPEEAEWRRDLSEQTQLHVTAAEALATVRDAWRDAVTTS
ncbi:nucleotidyl transferase AbiEii/AbiGii toxin family protein [Crossiella sp. SN42]|uniref:nucleotidyl transferase AbiEii/AbiGii toxin family protein n=1 Tax=Crossiella sp. SN42 TaxID=2944808 RepID=UPI00207D5E16|nr:nucleotidyl transferase AbiEii/AbiGii toxin family protein [Crossiella sp. SN42]MCO1579075.1 nucleotidyl transferase AbiEii/AbiGii toxin family protein [Crossiella sp. SN42]